MKLTQMALLIAAVTSVLFVVACGGGNGADAPAVAVKVIAPTDTPEPSSAPDAGSKRTSTPPPISMVLETVSPELLSCVLTALGDEQYNAIISGRQDAVAEQLGLVLPCILQYPQEANAIMVMFGLDTGTTTAASTPIPNTQTPNPTNTAVPQPSEPPRPEPTNPPMLVPTRTPVIKPITTTADIVNPTVPSEIECQTKHLDVTIFEASRASKEGTNLIEEWICLSEQLFFDKPDTNWAKLNPIYVVVLDRNNVDSAIELETVYCEHLKKYHNSGNGNNGYARDKCGPNYDPESHGCNYGLCLFTTKDGQVAGSCICSRRYEDGFYLFISKSHELPRHEPSYGSVTLHEMFHIFQQSNISRTDYSYDEFKAILGKRSGVDEQGRVMDVDVPWWNEGTAVYISHLYYSRQLGSANTHLSRQLERALWTDYDGSGRGNIIDQYQESGKKLYNLSFSGWEKTVAYQVGFWFVTYLVDQVGEDKLKEFYYGLEENGFEEAFEINFGKSYIEYVDDFDTFLTKSESEILSIIPQ